MRNAVRILHGTTGSGRGFLSRAFAGELFGPGQPLDTARHYVILPDAIVSMYDGHVPPQHYRGSCLFHATSGCTLPRMLRSDLCNRYVCGGLTQLMRALDDSDDTMAFVAADSVQLRRMALIALERSDPLSVAGPEAITSV